MKTKNKSRNGNSELENAPRRRIERLPAVDLAAHDDVQGAGCGCYRPRPRRVYSSCDRPVVRQAPRRVYSDCARPVRYTTPCERNGYDNRDWGWSSNGGW